MKRPIPLWVSLSFPKYLYVQFNDSEDLSINYICNIMFPLFDLSLFLLPLCLQHWVYLSSKIFLLAVLSVGDEILVINGKIVSDLDMVYIETLLHESKSLVVTVRSLRTNHCPAAVTGSQSEISNMMCPPPPSQSRIPEKVIENLTVPSPKGQRSNLALGFSVIPYLSLFWVLGFF